MASEVLQDYSGLREYYPELRLDPIPEGLVTVAQLERISVAYHKRFDWVARMGFLSHEILDASDATDEEKDFLLGKTDVDPNPSRRINYIKLVAGNELIQMPELIEDTPTPSRVAEMLRKTRRTLRRLGSGLSEKRAFFVQQFRKSIPYVVEASDMDISEWESLRGITIPDGEPAQDPRPYHEIKYRHLVPAPATTENPVFES